MASIPRKILQTAIDGIFLRDISYRDAEAIRSVAQNKDDDDDAASVKILHLIWRDFVCDEDGKSFDDVTNDPECVKGFPARINKALLVEVNKVLTPDPKESSQAT